MGLFVYIENWELLNQMLEIRKSAAGAANSGPSVTEVPCWSVRNHSTLVKCCEECKAWLAQALKFLRENTGKL